MAMAMGTAESGLRLRAVSVAAALSIATLAHGQSDNALSSSSTPAQIAPAGRGAATPDRRVLSLVPRLRIDSTWTDNVRLRSDGGKQSDLVTSVSPGLTFRADGDRLKASVDYSIRRLLHARDQSLDRNQNSLNAVGTYEMAENFAFLDFSGTISQQTISPFGTRSNSDTSFNDNRTEASLYRLSPHVRGQLGDVANYQARYARTMSRTKAETGTEYDANDYSLLVSGVSQQRAFNWALDASRQALDYSSGRSFEADRLRAFLTYPFSPQLSVSLIPGWESNNYTSATGEKESGTTFGGQVQWTVSDRTRLSALLEKRFFGRAYNVSAEHRTPRTAWRFSDSRDVTATPTQTSTVRFGTLYDLLLLQFSSIEPDEQRRAQLVEAFLVLNGLDRDTQVDLNFMTSAATVRRRQDLSFTLLGLRDTLTVLLSQSESNALLQVNAGPANARYVEQQGLSVVYSRRVTPQSTFNVLLAKTRASGRELSALSSDLRSVDVTLSTRLGQHATGTVGLRRSISSTTLTSTSESAIRAGLSLQF